MNVYIAFSYRDMEVVRSYLKDFQKNSLFNPIIASGGIFWKHNAKKQIRESKFVLFFCGTESCCSDSIGWEIQRAIEYGRRIYRVDLKDGVESHPALTIVDIVTYKETQYDQCIAREDATDKIREIIEEYMQDDYGLINPVSKEAEGENLPRLIEQYKTYVQTQEAVVNRRQKANSYYLSANSFFITIYLAYIELTKAFAIQSEMSNPNVTVTQNTLSIANRIGTAAICVIISIIGIILCVSWRKAIKSYCDLNTGKCAIIIMIEKKLPANTFDAEWKALKDSNYKTFTSSEKVVPVTFIAAYVFLSIVTLVSIFFA